MEKKSVVFCLFILILIFTCIISFSINSVGVLAQETEEEKAKDAYDWLINEVRGKWDTLTVKEHVFSMLALNCNSSLISPAKASLANKAVLGPTTKCWGTGPSRPASQNACLLTETALSKFVLNKFDENTTKIDNWLFDQKIFFKDILWFMQLDVDRWENAICYISYEGGNSSVKINPDKTLSDLSDNVCFSIYQNYWLQIKESCYEKAFKVRCFISDETKLFRVNFLYKKDLNKEWHVSSELWEEISGHEIEAHIGSYCLSNPLNADTCDYEGTAWAVYALKQTEFSETYADLIPYLVIESEDATNAKYFPEAFLYLIGLEGYGSEVEVDQNIQGFWKTDNTKYGQFYDTAIGGMTGKGNLNSEYGGARYYLTVNNPGFKQLGAFRYWKCAETCPDCCEELRDTAFLLWVYWSQLCFGGIGDCESQGFDFKCNETCIPGEEIEIPELACPAGLVCCQFIGSGGVHCSEFGGNCKTQCDTDEFEVWQIVCANTLDYCCKKYADAGSCDEFGAESCTANEDCEGTEVEILGAEMCCLGSCVIEGDYDYCSDMVPTAVSCYPNEVCINENTWSIIPFEQATNEDNCCPLPGICVEDISCSNKPGERCSAGYECIGTIEKTNDEEECCVGECLISCAGQGGIICIGDEECSVSYADASDTSKCCPSNGECKKPSSLWWIWILIAVFIMILVLLYFFKFRKPRPKKQKPSLFGIPPARRPLISKPRTQMPMRARRMPPPRRPSPSIKPMPRPSRTQPLRRPHQPLRKPPIAQAPKPKGKTEAELEKTLGKLKKMTKK